MRTGRLQRQASNIEYSRVSKLLPTVFAMEALSQGMSAILDKIPFFGSSGTIHYVIARVLSASDGCFARIPAAG